MSSHLKEKTVLVTGANGAIGNAFVEDAIRMGARSVICVDIAYTAFEEPAFPVSEEGEPVHLWKLKVDLGSENEVKALAGALKGLQIDCLIHSAGIKEAQGFTGEQVMNVNLHGTEWVQRYLDPNLTEDSSTIFMASDIFMNPNARDSYAISKMLMTAFAVGVDAKKYIIMAGPTESDLYAKGKSPEQRARIKGEHGEMTASELTGKVWDIVEACPKEVYTDPTQEEVYVIYQHQTRTERYFEYMGTMGLIMTDREKSGPDSRLEGNR